MPNYTRRTAAFSQRNHIFSSDIELMCVFVLFAAAQTLVSVQIVGSSQVFFLGKKNLYVAKRQRESTPGALLPRLNHPRKGPDILREIETRKYD